MTSAAVVRSPPAGYEETADRASASAALNASRSFCSAATCTERNRVFKSSDGGAGARRGSAGCGSGTTRGVAGTSPSAHSGGTRVCGLGRTVTVGLSCADAQSALAPTTMANHVAGRRTLIILQASSRGLFDLQLISRDIVSHLKVRKRASQLLLGLVVAAYFIQRHCLVEAQIFLAPKKRA